MIVQHRKFKKVIREGPFYYFALGPPTYSNVPELECSTKDNVMTLSIKNEISRDGGPCSFVELYQKWKETDNTLYLQIMARRVEQGIFE